MIIVQLKAYIYIYPVIFIIYVFSSSSSSHVSIVLHYNIISNRTSSKIHTKEQRSLQPLFIVSFTIEAFVCLTPSLVPVKIIHQNIVIITYGTQIITYLCWTCLYIHCILLKPHSNDQPLNGILYNIALIINDYRGIQISVINSGRTTWQHFTQNTTSQI